MSWCEGDCVHLCVVIRVWACSKCISEALWSSPWAVAGEHGPGPLNDEGFKMLLSSAVAGELPSPIIKKIENLLWSMPPSCFNLFVESLSSVLKCMDCHFHKTQLKQCFPTCLAGFLCFYLEVKHWCFSVVAATMLPDGGIVQLSCRKCQWVSPDSSVLIASLLFVWEDNCRLVWFISCLRPRVSHFPQAGLVLVSGDVSWSYVWAGDLLP